MLQLSFSAADAGLTSFSDGAAGFYNYSQSSVRYVGVVEDVVNASAPLTVCLILLGGLGVVGRRRRK